MFLGISHFGRKALFSPSYRGKCLWKSRELPAIHYQSSNHHLKYLHVNTCLCKETQLILYDPDSTKTVKSTEGLALHPNILVSCCSALLLFYKYVSEYVTYVLVYTWINILIHTKGNLKNLFISLRICKISAF